jgi:putative acetyltransferase
MMDITIIRTDSDNVHFKALINLLDAELENRYGDEQRFFSQFNSVVTVKHVAIALSGDEPVGCGAIKEYEPGTTEVKRMFVMPEFRGKGIAALLLTELEKWAKELGYVHTILQTGMAQPEAVALYTKQGYHGIENYGQYTGTHNSICMKKTL